jgi:cytochrome c5
MNRKMLVCEPLHTGKGLTGPLLVLLATALGGMSGAMAQERGLSGREVVEAVCAGCHASGAQGAPRIGDEKAWSKRVARGLSSLTQNALKGIRNMPPHGGRWELSDDEMRRAIVHMVNLSGGKWVEPVSKSSPPPERTGEQVVQAQCRKCHEAGTGGAPRIGDRDAWIPRLKNGLDQTVRSAMKGHGGMPARGGLADLSDAELRNAIIYMFRGAPPAN